MYEGFATEHKNLCNTYTQLKRWFQVLAILFSAFYIKEEKETFNVEEIFAKDGKKFFPHIENYLVLGKDLEEPTAEGDLLTTLAARFNNVEAMEALLRAGIDMNKEDARG